MRDENLVKLMFADQIGSEGILDLLRERKARFVTAREFLAAIVPGARREQADEDAGLLGPGLVHLYGLELVDTVIDWCDRSIRSIIEKRQ